MNLLLGAASLCLPKFVAHGSRMSLQHLLLDGGDTEEERNEKQEEDTRRKKIETFTPRDTIQHYKHI
jgi:hypothetical protein